MAKSKVKEIKKYTDIKSYEDACLVNGDDPKVFPDYSMLPKDEAEYHLNHFKLVRIIKALNKVAAPNWKPDFVKGNTKYYPWPTVKADKKRPSGFGFSYSCFGYDFSITTVGSRLCFASSELTLYALKQFEAMYIINQLSI